MVASAIILLPAFLSAQDYKKRISEGVGFERKAAQNTYVLIEQGYNYLAYNNANQLMIYESTFSDKLPYGKSPVTFSNFRVLDTLVFKIITPHFKKYSSPRWSDDIVSFGVVLYADLEGNVKEVDFSFPIDSKLPLTAIERLENAILEKNLKVELNHPVDSYYYRNAIWVEFDTNYPVSYLKRGTRQKME